MEMMCCVREHGDRLDEFISEQGVKEGQTLLVNHKLTITDRMPIEPVITGNNVKFSKYLIRLRVILLIPKQPKSYICHEGKRICDEPYSSLAFCCRINRVISLNSQPETKCAFIKGLELNDLPSCTRHVDLRFQSKRDEAQSFGWRRYEPCLNTSLDPCCNLIRVLKKKPCCNPFSFVGNANSDWLIKAELHPSKVDSILLSAPHG